MSDEEMKAVKGLEWSQQQMRLGNLPDYDQGHYADIKIVLNLVEKQSKEIEELTLDLEEMTKSNNHKKENWVHKSILNSYVSKEKIKAKIEELRSDEHMDDDYYIPIIAFEKLLQEEENNEC